jgi:hypothetical protein
LADPGIGYIFEHTRGKKVSGFHQQSWRMWGCVSGT